MRLRKIELIVIAITVAFVCFIGGYFTGNRGSVNIIAVEPQHGETHHFSVEPPSGTGNGTDQPDTAPEDASPPVSIEDEPATGEQPDVAPVETPSYAPTDAPRSDGRININTASRSELMDLPGIGSVLSERIVDYRTRNGAFSSIEDLMRVSGIGEKRFDSIKDKITVG